MKGLWERELSKNQNKPKSSETLKMAVVEAKFDFDERKVL